MSRNWPLQLEQGAQMYLLIPVSSAQSEKAFRICSNFFRPDTWKRQSVKLCPDMIANPLEVPEEIRVFPYTVNDPDRARELVDFGVSGIITDDPGLINQHLEATQ